MKIDDNDHRHKVALFRYGLIADFVNLPPTTKGLYARIRKKSDAEYVIPGTSRTRVASETIRDWLKCYRRGGFEALLPKPRLDRSQSRTLPDEVVEVLLATKQANPKLSVQLVIREALKHPEVPNDLPLPPSTVHRLLARHGLMMKSGRQDHDSDRRRFAFQTPGQLWMSDVMHGPAVRIADRSKRKTVMLRASSPPTMKGGGGWGRA